MNTTEKTNDQDKKIDKPDCYKCLHRRNLPGDCHISCDNKAATVFGNESGVKRGWFAWPWNYDPVWLVSCNGFQEKK